MALATDCDREATGTILWWFGYSQCNGQCAPLRCAECLSCASDAVHL